MLGEEIECNNQQCLNIFVKKTNNHKYCCSKCKNQRPSYSKYKNPLAPTFYKRKNVAQRIGIEFSIELQDLEIPEYCPILKTKIILGDPQYGLSIDRINSKFGYIKGNVQVISVRANMLKNNGTLEEFEKLVDWIKNNDK